MNRRTLPLSLLSVSLCLCGCGQTSSASSEDLLLANGTYSLLSGDLEKAEQAAGALESYLFRNHLAGYSLYGQADYRLYSGVDVPVSKGGRTFGITVPMDGDVLTPASDGKYGSYYHVAKQIYASPYEFSFFPSKVAPAEINKYYGNVMFPISNERHDGEILIDASGEEVELLPINPNEIGWSDVFRLRLPSGVKYHASLEIDSVFDGREVQGEDYLTFFECALAGNSPYRVCDLNFMLYGAEKYALASREGPNPDAFARDIGLSLVEENEKQYLEFHLTRNLSKLEFLIALRDEGFFPIPEEYLTVLGNGDIGKGFQEFGSADSSGNLRCLLSSPYIPVLMQGKQKVVLRRNPYFPKQHYRPDGVVLSFIENLEAALQDFLEGKLHECPLPSEKISVYRDDPRLILPVSIPAPTLNVNSCTSQEWERLFGEKGSVAQTPKEHYWNVKPIMSNNAFLDGFSFAIDRVRFANALNGVPVFEPYAPAFVYPYPNEGSYGLRSAHKAAIAPFVEGTDGYGYSLEKAKSLFLKASQELIQSGSYRKGETIQIEVAWMYENQIERMHQPLAKMIEEAFNTPENPLRIEVVPWVARAWSDVYLEKAFVGQFDFCYGKISGATWKSANPFYLARSDNPTGFTLNWGQDTDSVENYVEFDGKHWSFNALSQAFVEVATVKGGLLTSESPIFDAGIVIQGIQARCLTIDNVKWTTDAAHSERER